MKLSSSLPYRIQILNSNAWMPAIQAIEAIRIHRAREVYQDGQFVGIELGLFAPLPSSIDENTWPPAELPGVIFKLPASAIGRKRLMAMPKPWVCQ